MAEATLDDRDWLEQQLWTKPAPAAPAPDQTQSHSVDARFKRRAREGDGGFFDRLTDSLATQGDTAAILANSYSLGHLDDAVSFFDELMNAPDMSTPEGFRAMIGDYEADRETAPLWAGSKLLAQGWGQVPIQLGLTEPGGDQDLGGTLRQMSEDTYNRQPGEDEFTILGHDPLQLGQVGAATAGVMTPALGLGRIVPAAGRLASSGVPGAAGYGAASGVTGDLAYELGWQEGGLPERLQGWAEREGFTGLPGPIEAGMFGLALGAGAGGVSRLLNGAAAPSSEPGLPVPAGARELSQATGDASFDDAITPPDRLQLSDQRGGALAPLSRTPDEAPEAPVIEMGPPERRALPPPSAGMLSPMIDRIGDQFRSPDEIADRMLLRRAQAAGLRPEDIERLSQSTGQPGVSTLADAGGEFRDLLGSAARQAGPDSEEAIQTFVDRRAARAPRMRDTFAASIDAPSDVRTREVRAARLQQAQAELADLDARLEDMGPSAEAKELRRARVALLREIEGLRATEAGGGTPNAAIRARRADARAEMNKLARDRGYAYGEGLNFDDRPVPREFLNPAADLPENYTFADWAADMFEEFKPAHKERAADIQRSLNDGRTVSGGPIEFSGDLTGADFQRMPDKQVKAMLRSRDIHTSNLYDGDPTKYEVEEGRLKPTQTGIKARDRKALLRRVIQRERDNPAPRYNRDVPSVAEMQAVKQSMWGLADAAGRAGDSTMEMVHKRNFGRLRKLLHEGARDGSKRRVIKVGDAYHRAAENALAALEAGENAFQGGAKGTNRFLDALEEIQAARRDIETDTSFSKAVRANILREFDHAEDALKASAVNSYSQLLRSSRVGRDARIFNAGQQGPDGEQVLDQVDDVMLDRLNAIFETPADRDRFLRTVDAEYQAQLTERELFGNSATARRMASDAAFREEAGGAFSDVVVETIAEGPRQALYNWVKRQGRWIGDRYVQGVTERVADKLMQRLASTDLEAVARELRRAERAGEAPNFSRLQPGLRAAVNRAAQEAKAEEETIQRFSTGTPEQRAEQIDRLERQISRNRTGAAPVSAAAQSDLKPRRIRRGQVGG